MFAMKSIFACIDINLPFKTDYIIFNMVVHTCVYNRYAYATYTVHSQKSRHFELEVQKEPRYESRQ